jgi:anti-sigma B factor antagonist
VQVSVSSHRSDGVLTVTVAGEVDLSTGAAVQRAIWDAVETEGVREVHLDLSDVSFLDSSGIALLLHGRRSADERGLGYRVTGAQGMVRQVLEMTGVWGHLSGEAGSSDLWSPSP